MRQTDLQWLLSLGVSVQEAANRVSRTVTAVEAELARTEEAQKDDQ